VVAKEANAREKNATFLSLRPVPADPCRSPLGYRRTKPKQFNSMIYSNTALRYVEFGWLYTEGFLNTPQAYYCPSENDPQSMFNTPANPWPPGPLEGGNPALNGYAGYAMRPETPLPDDPADFANPTLNLSLPRLTRFKNKAVLADLNALPARVDTRHRVGLNALYGDGSARWVDRKLFDASLRPCTSINPSFDSNQDAIWLDSRITTALFVGEPDISPFRLLWKDADLTPVVTRTKSGLILAKHWYRIVYTRGGTS